MIRDDASETVSKKLIIEIPGVWFPNPAAHPTFCTARRSGARVSAIA